MNTTTTLTAEQVEFVLDAIRSTGRRGADHTQVTRFVERAAGISGCRAGYDAPWTRTTVDDAVNEVLAEATARGFRTWTTGSGTYAVQRVGA